VLCIFKRLKFEVENEISACRYLGSADSTNVKPGCMKHSVWLACSGCNVHRKMHAVAFQLRNTLCYVQSFSTAECRANLRSMNIWLHDVHETCRRVPTSPDYRMLVTQYHYRSCNVLCIGWTLRTAKQTHCTCCRSLRAASAFRVAQWLDHPTAPRLYC
jgi:hypothetical protein